ncbi:ankyrin repeat domain-containing protein [Pyxidicoccus parkwayensis]|uniref:Ankyrin repeat domain-containing protein n=1 Tax=Pyxidicoccus parkwayensis TaxID=2813578 RepID=A0ABX7NW53_9BACT|nr:ankyrin repeat domain-containing protein [Pyxidicoccus parkwaysis]QSQ23171.1 ankyrin repeat domain-containing protein [Pyxidicoccus parkwaysis]
MSTSTNPDATQALLSLCQDRQRWRAELSAAAVSELLSRGADVNGRGDYGSTPLHFAVLPPYQKDHPLPSVDVVRTLLDAGADPNARDDHTKTPLLRALPSYRDDAAQEQRALEIIHLLREAGAKVPPDVKDARAAAFDIGSPRLYQELLDAGAPIDVRDDKDATPLHQAAQSGSVPIAEMLLARGAEVNALDGLGRTPLRAALRGRVDHKGRPHSRTPEYDALIALLERAGGQPHVPYSWSEDPFAPFPFDTAALRAAVPKSWLSFNLDVDSAQELATVLESSGDPDQALAVLATLRDVLDVPPRHVRLQGPLTLERPFFHHGDLEVEGHLAIHKAFAVTGSLIVHGVLEDQMNDSLVNILGDVRCHALNTDGDFSVRGDIHARDVVLGHHNDCLLLATAIHARVVIEDDHAVSGEVHAEQHFDINTYTLRDGGDEVPKRLRALFVDEVMEEDGLVCNSDLFDRLRKGLPVFRGQS